MSTDRTDPMAAHRAAQQLRDAVGAMNADKIVDQFAVHFEHRVNGNGVAVRRVVMYGPEEVDPNPPAELLAEVRERLAVREPVPA